MTPLRTRKTVSQSICGRCAAPCGNATQVLRNTDSLRLPGMYRQISSAVNDRIGASQRTIASAIQNIAVCAERRAWLFAGVVYSRSLSTSR